MTTSSTQLSHTHRIFVEQLGQALFVSTGFVDKIILTSVIFRIWNTRVFEDWSTCIAFAGICSLFEFGFNIYFNNRIMIETEQGRRGELTRTYHLGNTLFALCGLAGFVAMAAAAFIFFRTGRHDGQDVAIAAILLCGAGSARLTVSAANALYRANRQYARFTIIQSVSELSRIGLLVVIIIAGGGLVLAALVSAVTTILISVIYVLIDTRSRFFPHDHGFAIPRLTEMGEVMSMSTAYFAQMLPVVFWTSLPVLVLQKMPLAAGLLASFILIRTISNLARSPLQSFAIVFGQECGRRIANFDLAGALMVLKRGSRLFAAVSGLASGVLIVGGARVISLWTGDASMFHFPLMVSAMAPMAVASASVLTHNVLIASNAPYPAAAGRWLQVVITVGSYFLLPIHAPPLKMMVALSAGEIFGYAPLAYFGMARLVPGAGVQFHLHSVLLTLLSMTLGGAATELAFHLIGDHTNVQLIASLSLTAVFCAVVVPFAGLNMAGRSQIWRQIVRPMAKQLAW